MSSDLRTLKRYFELRSSHVSDYWLQCCLDWFKSEYNTYTDDFMCSSVYQQWLDHDLREIEVRSLPNNINQQKKTIINGKYVVQVLCIKDISKPAYTQIKNMRDMFKLTRAYVDTENEPVEASGKRVLHLYLTDGVQSITGFEYHTVSCLHLYLAPGVKLLLTGPLLVRNGEFMLKDNNVKIIGGEIESLRIPNAAENVLAKKLNLPENPNPRSTEVDNTDNTQINIYTSYTTNNTNTNVNIVNNSVNKVNNNLNNVNSHLLDIEDDQFFANFDTSAFEDEEQTLHAQQNRFANYENDFDQNDDLFENLDIPEPQINYQPSTTNLQQNTNVQQTIILHNQDIEEAERLEFERQLQDEEDFDFNLQDDISLDQIIEKTKPKPAPIISTPDPFVYIKHLQKNTNILSPNETYRVKAWFANNIEKIKLSKDTGWTMKFEIKDSSGKLIVDIISDVIQDLMGLSPLEALTERKRVKNKETKSHEKLNQALAKCKEKLESEFIMDLKYENNFTIVGLQTVKKQHLEGIKNRVQSVPVKLF